MFMSPSVNRIATNGLNSTNSITTTTHQYSFNQQIEQHQRKLVNGIFNNHHTPNGAYNHHNVFVMQPDAAGSGGGFTRAASGANALKRPRNAQQMHHHQHQHQQKPNAHFNNKENSIVSLFHSLSVF